MVRCERVGERVVVELSGELDHASAAGARREIDRWIEDSGVREVVFDLKGLTFMDSSGLGVILGRYRVINGRGGSVWIRGARMQVDRLLNMSGIYRMVRKIS